MLKLICKLIKILFIALIIFGVISMIVSLIATFSMSAKIATERSTDLFTGQDLAYQLGLPAADNVETEDRLLTLSR